MLQCLTAENVPVEILGAERVNHKLAGITAKAVAFPNAEDERPCEYHQLKRIIFNDMGYPAGKLGMTLNNEITINLRECFAAGVTLAEDDDTSSIIGMAWWVTLRAIFHELFHIWVMSKFDLKFDDPELEEEHAELFAEKQVSAFSMVYDVDIPPLGELGLFDDLLMDYMQKRYETDPDENWLKCQKEMLDNNHILVKDGVPVQTFREFIRLVSDYEIRISERWERPGLVTWHNVPPAEAAPPAPPAENNTPSAPPAPPAPPAEEVAPATEQTEGPQVDYEDAPPCPDMEEYEGYGEDTYRQEAYQAYTPTEPKGYVPDTTGIPMEEAISTIQAIYMRLSQTIFDKCDFNGRGKFGNPGGVLDPVSVDDLPHASLLVHSYETVNQFGQKAVVDCLGQIRGTVFNKSGLPAYILYLNIGGKLLKRTLVPQNPDKGSKSAKAAQEGDMIVWIINSGITDQEIENLRNQGKRASKFIAMIKNGQYITLK